MSQIMRERFKEICPRVKFSEWDILEVEKGCRIAFKIVGYMPENFDDAFRKTWESSEAEMLDEFVYDCWRNDE